MASSKNRKGGVTQAFTQGFTQELHKYLHKELHNYLQETFEVLRLKIVSEGTLV